MRKSLRIASMVLAALLFFSYDSLKAQVKIGGNPADIDPASILELESTKKGFLLPRVSDMSVISASLKEGYLVYYLGTNPTTDPAGLFVKIGTNMVRVSTESGTGAPWKLDGNAGVAGAFLGTKDAFPLLLKSNNNTGITIGTDGRLIFGFVDAAAVADGNEILLLAPDGTVKKKDLAQSSVTKLNGLQGDNEITLNGSLTDVAPAITTTPPAGGLPGQIELSYPVLQGQAASYGFLSGEDYKKLVDIMAADGIKVIAPLTAGNEVAEGAVFQKNADPTSGKWELALSPATGTMPGIVTIGAQTFAGDKTFVNTVTKFDGAVEIKRNAALPGAATLTVEGAVTLDGVTAQTLVNTDSYNLLLQNVTGAGANELKKVTVPGWKLTGTGIGQISTPTGVPAVGTATGDLAFETVTTGTDFAISSAADKVTFALPDASATARGVVSTAAQSFTGDKTFETKVLVGPAAGAVTTTSNLNVNGSLGVKFKTLTTGSTIGPDDYIVMVAATGPTSAITLPDATTCAGRVYVIKRIAGDPLAEEDNNIVVTPNGSQTINGIANTKITVVHTSITLLSDGANWQLLSRGTGF